MTVSEEPSNKHRKHSVKTDRSMANDEAASSQPSSSSSPSGRLQLPSLTGASSPVNATTPLASPRRENPRVPGSPSVSHRSSFAENLRSRQRNPSFGQQALQELINNPPVARNRPDGDRYQDRDWRTIRLGEIIAPEEVRFVETDTSVEEATKVSDSAACELLVL